MPQQVPNAINGGAGTQPYSDPEKKKIGVNNQPNGLPMNPLGSLGMMPQQPGPAQGGIIQDENGKGFTNPNGDHDWNVGYGPGGDFGGQISKTGLSVMGVDPGSGDALGIARKTPEYRAAQAAHQAWIQQNLGQGRHLADLGMDPTKGGGLAAYMQLGSLFKPGPAGGTGQPISPQPVGPTPAGPTPAMPPLASPGSAPTTPGGFVNNGQTPGIVPGVQNQRPQLTAQKRRQPMGSLGFGASPINTARVM